MRTVAALVVCCAVARATAADGQSATPSAARSIPADQAVLQGRVVEVGSGRPVAGAQVQAMSAKGTFETTTDAEGRYEIAAMTPGSYTVAARAKGFADGYYGREPGMARDFGAQVVAGGGRMTAGIDVRLQSAGRVSGRILDLEGRGLPGVEIELIRATSATGDSARAVGFAQTVSDGVYELPDVAPGSYIVRAHVGGSTTPDGSAVYASTFYPGVRDRDTAQSVHLYAGQELLDVDFPLATTSRFSVAGRIVDEVGDSLDGLSVRLQPMSRDQFTGFGGGPFPTAPVDVRGRFEFRDVLPGTYLAHLAPRSPKPGPPMPGGPGRLGTLSSTVTVAADVFDLELRVTPAARVSLSLVPDFGITRAIENGSFGLQIVQGPMGGLGFSMSGFGRAGTQGDAAIELSVVSGPAFFKVEAPAGWMVKAIRLDGRDVEDGPVELAPGRREVEVVLTDRVSGVSGTVIDRRGRALANHSVIVFPPESAKWHAVSRAIREERTGNDGRFMMEALPPGTYRAVAVPALERGASQSPAVLERLLGVSEAIRVLEGQSLTVSIRASALPDGLAP